MKIKELIKKLNKKVVAAIISAAILISAVAGVSVFKYQTAKAAGEGTIATVQPVKTDLQKTLSATGTIISAEESGQFASVSGTYPIEEVYVKVGDTVKKGDPLYKLDMTSMQQQLSYQQQALNIQNEQNQIAAETAAKSLEDAMTNGAIEVNNANTSLAQKQQDLQKAKDDVASLKRTISSVESRMKEEEADTAALSAENEGYKATLKSTEETIKSLEREIAAAQVTAGSTQNTANSNNFNQMQNVRNQELSAKSSTLSSQQEIAKSKEELSKAVVYASQDGTVTNVNIVKGQTYSGTDAVVIDNVTSLKATADIDEANIAKVAVGQKVQIKTDATGDEILNGTVSFVSPTATKNSNKTTDSTASSTASVSKSRATYRVDVVLEGTNDALRLGMTAKMTIVLAESKDALSVPTSDVQTDMDGNSYVVVQNADGTTKNVSVTTGISDDFYTEITGGDLKETDVIVENSTDDASADSILDSMGADGGIYDE